MELLGTEPAFNIIGEKGQRIYARNYAMPSSFIAKESKNVNSFPASGNIFLQTRARSPAR